MNVDRYSRLVEAERRAHARFIRRSDRSIAVFPADRFYLHRLASQAHRLANDLRTEISFENAALLQLNRRNPS